MKHLKICIDVYVFQALTSSAEEGKQSSASADIKLKEAEAGRSEAESKVKELEVQLTEAETKISATTGAGERLEVLETQLRETKGKLTEAEATSAGYPEKVQELEGKLQETMAKLTDAEANMSESAGLLDKLRLSEEKFKQKESELSALQKRNQVRITIQ